MEEGWKDGRRKMDRMGVVPVGEVPPQHKIFEPPIDYRNQVITVNRKTRKGAIPCVSTRNIPFHTRKRGREEDEDDEMEEDEASRGAEENEGKLYVGKRRAYQTNQPNLGRVSGRDWKAPKKRMSSTQVLNDSQKKRAEWTVKMAATKLDKDTKAKIKDIKQTELDKVKAEKLRRAELKKKKEQNRKNNANLHTQKITNSKTLKKMSKKAQKGVRFVKEVV